MDQRSVAAGQGGIDESYYEHPREEIAVLVPPGTKRAVDLGCGAGALGELLRATRPGLEVRGVEIVPSAAERARAVLDDVACQDASSDMPERWPRPDCLICADVLEHLADPWATLTAWRQHLEPGGYLVGSVPNIAHRSVVLGLLHGQWHYGAYGILDRTHLRFFTRCSMLAMIIDAGYRVVQVRRVFDVLPTTRRGVRLRAMLDGIAAREPIHHDRHGPGIILADLWTTQFLVVARG
jgi:2-polyprenyl-3-methyl-5-hydroxy-6-metoxy-1,4-benzoquinol methylase